MVSCMKDWQLKWRTSAEGVHCSSPFEASVMHRYVCRADGQLMTSVFVEGFDSTRPVQRDWTKPRYWDWFWAAKRMFAGFALLVFLRYSVPRVFLQWYEVCVSFLRQVYIIAASQPDFERSFNQMPCCVSANEQQAMAERRRCYTRFGDWIVLQWTCGVDTKGDWTDRSPAKTNIRYGIRICKGHNKDDSAILAHGQANSVARMHAERDEFWRGSQTKKKKKFFF